MNRPFAMALLLAGASAALADDPKPARPREGQIELARCRIRMIDQVTLASDRNGVVAFVEPGEGGEVRAGQEVAGLMDEVPQAALAVAKKKADNDIEIRFSKKAAEVAQVEHEKALEANRTVRNAVPDIEVRRLKLAAEKSLLQIEQAQHQKRLDELSRDQAEAEARTFRIKAPFDGSVTRTMKKKGESVRQGDPILELSGTRRVRVEGDLDLKHVTEVRPGCRVVVRLDIPDVDLPIEKETFEGKIEFVDVSVQPVSRQIRIWAEVQNREDILRAGLTARMTIVPISPATTAEGKRR